MNIVKKLVNKQKCVADAPPITIAFFGDSVTQGCFELYRKDDENLETEFRVEESYALKFRSILQMLYPNVPVNMIHAGISGDNAPNGLKRIKRDVCAYKPDLTIFCFGLNDCGGGMKNLENYKNAVSGIIKELKDCGTEIIFLTPNIMADSVSSDISDEFLREVCANIIQSAGNSLEKYIEEAVKICKSEKVPVCDCYKLWNVLKQNEVNVTRLLSNRINHPTEKMHWLFAFKLIETIFTEE